MSLKAQDGSSTSMATHSKRPAIFVVGSQRPCHWPVLCVGQPRLTGSWWALRLMTAAPLNGCVSKLCLNYLFYHHSTILIPLFSLPAGLCRDEKIAWPTGRLMQVWIFFFLLCVCACVCVLAECFYVCVWSQAGVCLYRHRFRSLALGELRET